MPETDLNFPIKILYEYYKCEHCRKRAMFYMDGLGYCLDDVYRVNTPMLRKMIRNIVYRVGR